MYNHDMTYYLLHERKNKILRIIEQLVSKILALYFSSNMYSTVIEMYFSHLDRLMTDRGLPFTVKYVKDSRDCVMRVLSGRPLDACPGVALKEGWPEWLTPFRYLSESIDGIRVLTTLLVVLRGVHLKAELDLNPIISPWKDSLPEISEKRHYHVCRGLGIRRKSVEWSKPHMSTKRGPLG